MEAVYEPSFALSHGDLNFALRSPLDEAKFVSILAPYVECPLYIIYVYIYYKQGLYVPVAYTSVRRA